MGRLAVNVLGGFQASLDSGAPCTLPTKKARALLAYLALAPGRVCPRPALASLLWGERGDAQALKSLRQTVYTLRRAVEKIDPSVLLLEGGIAANPAALDVDAIRFERLVKEGTPLALERVAALYRGDLLQGFTLDEAAFEEWLVAERQRLRELAIDALARLLAHQAATSATEAGIQTAVRLLALDPLQEHAHRALMRLYARQGRRSAALRQYQVCVDLMRRELRTEPDTETKELYLELLQDRRGARGEQEPMSASSEPRMRAPMTRERLELAFPEGPLIGRERELARLRESWRLAQAGRGQVAVVYGEAGIGKTRLLAELATEALESGSHVLLGRAFESEQLLAFGPWVDAIRGSGLLDAPGILDPLAQVWRSELIRLFPELGDAVPAHEPGSEQHLRLFEAMGRLLSVICERRPTLLVLENLHRADEMSVRLLAYVGRRTHAWRLLVVASARQEELGDTPTLPRAVGELVESGRCDVLTLMPLMRGEIAELLRSMMRSGGRPSAGLVEQVWTWSEGNPFMAMELIRVIEQEGGVWSTSASPPVERVRTLLTSRLDRLSPLGQQVAAVAAVIGREFEFGLLQRAAGLSGREAAAAVEELVRRRVLHGAGDRLDFAHDRIREVAYERLLSANRQVLHRDVATALEATIAPPPASRYDAEQADPQRVQALFETLAWHYTQGAEWSKAVDYLFKAADKARLRYAYKEASRRCAEALEILDRQDGATTEKVRALETLGDLESLQGHVEPGNEAYDRASALSRDAATRRRIGDKQHRFGIVVRNGIRIGYYEHGGGEPTLFLTHPVFYGQGTYQPLLDILCHEYRIITGDPRGAGGSDPLPDVYRLRDHVEDARAVIEGIGNRPVVFVGMSRAAALGVVLATSYPHLVEKLVLIGTPPAAVAIPNCPGIDQEFWQQIVAMIRADDYQRAMPLFWAREFSEPGRQDLVDTFVKISLGMPREVFRVFFTVADPGRDIRHLLPTVRVPTLVLHGEDDRIVPVEAGRWVAQQIPGAEFHAFKGCGHLPVFTAPDEVVKVIRTFLTRGPRPV